ncbi:MAG TPA: alpha-glucan family phosphorylase [Paludibacteraceae bacterium]|nr:alpha-glucan family phosphorylase [Paludibacteraceae bacterium]HQF49760.1 alpha-glucan family phosphorylase [Paludibacteraceae bacterium]
MKVKVNQANLPQWKDITVKAKVPVKMEKLLLISQNLWWVWNDEASNLFNDIDETVWNDCGKNPALFLGQISIEKLEEIEQNSYLIRKIDDVYEKFEEYMSVPKDPSKPSVAYFSMEYGLTDILKIYSGGLGVLAGDYLKEASDCNVNMTAVGFLYRHGYFTQSLSMNGEQIAVYEPLNFSSLPISQVKDENGVPMILEVPFYDRIIYANIWKVAVGRINLYLMDTDLELNSEFDRSITHQLYGGDWENRLKQEYMLGIGGITMLNKLGIKHDTYHCNEGHAALINIQRLCDYIEKDGLTYNQAFEVVRSSSIYTVHTPVPAGHDKFDECLFGKYMYKFPENLGITWDNLMDLGRENPGDKSEKFSMSVFACNTCQEVNGVSWLHGEVSKKMFAPIWKGYFPEELHVNYVTNGVHMPTWADEVWKKLYSKHFEKNFMNDQSNGNIWSAIQEVSDEEIWETKSAMKKRLIDFIKIKYKESWMKNMGDPKLIMSIIDKIRPDALTIGFGRRFATYKRAHLLFTDLDRLEKIVNNPKYPVQFIYTGKAHPADGAGQGLIQRIIEISRMPQFQGKIIFLENYDMALAKKLISGVDIWLNTPTRPLEASGTSGEKALMNGVINFSVLDGWWLEGYVKGAGWALTEKRTYDYQPHQDQLDAATIYSILENEIVPMYFATNSRGYSPEWIQTIKNSISLIAPKYTTKRMLDDYTSKFYTKLRDRFHYVSANNFAKAKEIAAWKETIDAKWDEIEVISTNVTEKATTNPEVGDPYSIDAIIDVKDPACTGIGVDFLLTMKDKKNLDKLVISNEMELVKTEGTKLYFKYEDRVSLAGAFKYAFRMFPKNADLPHRMDFCYVRWF